MFFHRLSTSYQYTFQASVSSRNTQTNRENLSDTQWIFHVGRNINYALVFLRSRKFFLLRKCFGRVINERKFSGVARNFAKAFSQADEILSCFDVDFLIWLQDYFFQTSSNLKTSFEIFFRTKENFLFSITSFSRQ